MANQSIYINPLTDFGFKYLFGEEEHKEFLISFLNALFSEEDPIVDVTFIDKEHIGMSKNERALIYDIHCTTATGKKLIVEMLNRYQAHFRERALYYMSVDIAHQGLKGDEWDYRLMPVYGVFLMNFDWKEFEDEQMREDVGLMNIRTKELFSDRLRMVFIKIPMLEKDAEDCKEVLDRWLYILKNMEIMERIPVSFTEDPVFRKLGKVARVGALTEAQRRAYDHSLKVYRDNYAIAQTERDLGREEGLKEGIAETIGKMLTGGISAETIASALSMPISEVRKYARQ